MADPRTLYDTDFVAWSKQQAEALRAAARDGSNQPLDLANLAEEIEGLGISQKSALGSQIRRIIHHLLKLEYSGATEPRRGWIESINDARIEIEAVLEDSPSLKNEITAAITAEMRRGLRKAIADLKNYENIDPATLARMQGTAYTQEQVLGDWFPEGPAIEAQA
jgi:hypothetical protein